MSLTPPALDFTVQKFQRDPLSLIKYLQIFEVSRCNCPTQLHKVVLQETAASYSFSYPSKEASVFLPAWYSSWCPLRRHFKGLHKKPQKIQKSFANDIVFESVGWQQRFREYSQDSWRLPRIHRRACRICWLRYAINQMWTASSAGTFSYSLSRFSCRSWSSTSSSWRHWRFQYVSHRGAESYRIFFKRAVSLGTVFFEAYDGLPWYSRRAHRCSEESNYLLSHHYWLLWDLLRAENSTYCGSDSNTATGK